MITYLIPHGNILEIDKLLDFHVSEAAGEAHGDEHPVHEHHQGTQGQRQHAELSTVPHILNDNKGFLIFFSGHQTSFLT